MDEARRSNRPAPRTPAAVEAELRRRIRVELAEARERADGELDDAALAEVIARAIGAAFGWHVEAPEHARNATLSSRTWRGAGGPRGGGAPRDFDAGPSDRGPRQYGGGARGFGDDADFEGRPERPPRQSGPRGGRPGGRGGGYGQRRDFDSRGQQRSFDESEDRPRRAPGPRRPPGPRGGGGRPGGRGGFGPRRPR
ncbi:MAG: hypothetical protein JOY61_19895 [Chloroflexi bacterium]|nr:hypothetical protein [Chloroflexota bacterium]